MQCVGFGVGRVAAPHALARAHLWQRACGMAGPAASRLVFGAGLS